MFAAFEPNATQPWVHVAAHFGLGALSVALWRTYGHRWLAWLACAWAGAGATVAIDAWLRHSSAAASVAELAAFALGLLTAGLFAISFAALFGVATQQGRLRLWLPLAVVIAWAGAAMTGSPGTTLVRIVAAAQAAVFAVAGTHALRNRSRRHRTGRIVLASALLIAVVCTASAFWMPLDSSAVPSHPLLGPITLLAHMSIGIGVSIWALEFEHDLLQRAADTLQEWDREQFARQKAETVRRMAGGVAHGFNNLLTSVLGHADLIEDHSSGATPITSSIGEIRQAVKRGASLTHQLLSVSSQQTERADPLDMDRKLSEASAAMRERLGEHIRLVLDQGPRGVRS